MKRQKKPDETFRVCALMECMTVLSGYNPGPRCFLHTPDRYETELWNRMRLAPRNFEGKPLLELTHNEQENYDAWEGGITTDQLRRLVAEKSSAQRRTEGANPWRRS